MQPTILNSWNQFWFRPANRSRLLGCRIAIAVACMVWILSLWSEATQWFSSGGVLNSEQSSRALDYEQISAWQYWSPLWLTESSIAFQLWLGCGLVLGMLVALGIGTWISPLLLCLFAIATAHRLVWLAGLTEPLLVAYCGYLAVGQTKDSISWRINAAIRLMQAHTWIVIAAGLVSKLASLIWWRGEAVWWLASAGRSNLIGTDTLANRPLLVNALTHGWVTLDILTLWLLVVPSTRKVGFVLGLLNCAAIGLVADQFVYSIAILAGLVAFVDWPATRLSLSAQPSTTAR